MGKKIEIAWFGKHFGEEPPISGPLAGGGSGTIFFCRCNLKCVFCQNWQISQATEGFEGRKGYEGKDVVKIILDLQEQGAENINLVTPTPWAFWLKDILIEAKKEGLRLPVVWNSNGYEDLGVLKEMGDLGLIDIYLPDYKYSDEQLAIEYSSAPNYPKIAREAILEMYRQVGDFQEEQVGQEGIRRTRGLIVRHLIIPGQIENTIDCLKFIHSISPNIHLSLMTQYNPLFKAKDFPEINRNLNREEYDRVLREVENLGFDNGWVQEFGESTNYFTPDFKKQNPFRNGGN